MHDSCYILTSVIPRNGEFEAYLRDIKSNEVRKEIKKLNSTKKYENISMILQFFIENNIYPHSLYDGRLNPKERMDFKSFEEDISKRCINLDIEVLNPNRIPRSDIDEIISISYGNSDYVVVRFNGEGEKKVGKNYIVYFDDEKNILKETFEDLAGSSDLFLCGHNISGFDLRYLKERAEILKIPNEIKTHSAKTMFNNKKVLNLPNFINIDLLPILQYAGLPSTKLEYVAKTFGLESKKMAIEELWLYYNQKQFERIIGHNVNDVITTSEVLKKVSPSIYLLAEKTIGTFMHGFYSNLPKNIMVRTILNHYKEKGYEIDKILEIIDRELRKISFSLDREKVEEKLEVKVDARLEKAKLLDLDLIVSEKLKDYNLAFEDLLKTYQEIDPNSIEEKISKRMISGIIHKLLSSMRKIKEYKNKVEPEIKKIKDEVGEKSRIYCSSGKYLIVNDSSGYSSPLTNVVLHSKSPKIFLANCGGILIGTIPKKSVGMPEKFYESFIQDLFNIGLNKPAEEMQKMRKKLDGELSLDELKIEVRGVDVSQLSRDSQKKIFVDKTIKREMEPWERIYVIKLNEGFLTLEEMRKNPERICEVDLDFYRKEFSKLWKIYEKIKSSSSQNSLSNFFG